MTEAEIRELLAPAPDSYRDEPIAGVCDCIECRLARYFGQALAEKIDREMMEAPA